MPCITHLLGLRTRTKLENNISFFLVICLHGALLKQLILSGLFLQQCANCSVTVQQQIALGKKPSQECFFFFFECLGGTVITHSNNAST